MSTISKVGLGRNRSAIAAIILALALPAAAAELPKSIDALAWMSGTWRAGSAEQWVEEQWTTPEAGGMFATARTVAKGKTVFYEWLRIEQRESGLVYIASPKGASPVEFPLFAAEAKRAEFRNPQHDYPRRIVYWLDEHGQLHAGVGDLDGELKETWSFRRK